MCSTAIGSARQGTGRWHTSTLAGSWRLRRKALRDDLHDTVSLVSRSLREYWLSVPGPRDRHVRERRSWLSMRMCARLGYQQCSESTVCASSGVMSAPCRTSHAATPGRSSMRRMRTRPICLGARSHRCCCSEVDSGRLLILLPALRPTPANLLQPAMFYQPVLGDEEVAFYKQGLAKKHGAGECGC